MTRESDKSSFPSLPRSRFSDVTQRSPKSSFGGALRESKKRLRGRLPLPRHSRIPSRQKLLKVFEGSCALCPSLTPPLMIQFNLSTTATLGTEERMDNVWTVRHKWWPLAGVHNPERATPILGRCHGIFTDQFIFRHILGHFFPRK